MRLTRGSFFKSLREVENESGFMLIQIVLTSAALLFVLFTGFNSVRSTIKAANTSATSAAFKDFILTVEQNLALSATCMQRLGFGAAPPQLATLNIPAGFPLTVLDPEGTPLARVEPDPPVPCNSSPIRCPSPDFRIKEVRLRNFKRQGWTAGSLPGNGQQELDRYSAELWITAERRGGSSFFGSVEMFANIPLLFGVTPAGLVRNCTKRGIFQIELGPPTLPAGVTRKSGVECIDRGGMPLIAAGTDWYVCRIPISAYGVCKTTGTYCADSNADCNLPGWYCQQATDPLVNGGETFVY
jgi:hypothetical protein